MEGTSEQPGIIPRALERLFGVLERDETDFTMHVTYLELHNENLRDLLADRDGDQRLQLMDASRNCVVVRGCTETVIATLEDAYGVIRMGRERKQIAATRLNQQSR